MNETEKNVINEEELQNSQEEAEKNDESEIREEDKSIDYAQLAREDMQQLISIFPHLSGKQSITELSNPLRYAALRDLGLTPKEAFLATEERLHKYDNRSHLCGLVPKAASVPDDILTAKELEGVRTLFSGLSDREIQKLYKKVTR